MTGKEMAELRKAMLVNRGHLAELLGYTGSERNNELTIKRYEMRGDDDVPEMVARLVQMLSWYYRIYGCVPNRDV